MPDLRKTVVVVREEEGGIKYGVAATGPVKVLEGGGIIPVGIADLYPGEDLSAACEAVGCFNARFGDCEGVKANCLTLNMVLCRKHHDKVHGRGGHTVALGSFTCWPPVN